jgi:kumamolisin
MPTQRSFVPLIAAMSLLAVTLPSGRPAAAGPQPWTLAGHVPAIVALGPAVLLGRHNPNDVLHLAIALQLRHRAALQGLLQAIDNPASPVYHHYLTQQQANQRFTPTVAQEKAVAQWLRGDGLTVMHTYPNHLLVDAQGTTAQIERLLHLSINDYHALVQGKERTFYSPSWNPTVPAHLRTVVQSITGLDSYPRIVSFLNGKAHRAPPYYPRDFANAYNVNPLWNGHYTGAGQHIGITVWTVPPSDRTLRHFASVTGAAVATVANGRLKVIRIDGGSSVPDQGEAAMDIEYTSSLAPSATINFYEAPTDSSGNPTVQGLEDALNRAGTGANQQISNSWGGCERSSTADPFTSATTSIFEANEATGHAYVFASGDNGSWCGVSGLDDGQGPFPIYGQDPYPSYPASSPYVTSVGGTRFGRAVGASWPGESTWTYCVDCSIGTPVGSGGGYSILFKRPSWQKAYGPSGLADNGQRGYPDIAADADPQTGAYVCYGDQATCDRFGGTSLSSPLWAGMIAVVNSYLAARGKTVGFLAPALYNLVGTRPRYPAFHDITSGTNGTYQAQFRWDAVTGWGSTNLYNLARDLAAVVHK